MKIQTQRQMGSLMRRMCDMTGEKMDGVMEEVVRKLEEGSNPEELEAKIEGIMDDADAADEENEGAQIRKARKQKARMILTRDPELYEMQDFYLDDRAFAKIDFHLLFSSNGL